MKQGTVKFYDAGGDLTKRWFVYFYDKTNKRKKVFAGINCLDSAKARWARMRQIAQELAGVIPGASERKNALTEKGMRERLSELADKKRWRKKTRQTEISRLNVFFDWLEKNLLAFDERSVKAFFDELQRKKSATTTNHYRGTFLRVLPLHAREWLDDVPFKRPNSHPARYFTLKQAKELKARISKEDPQLWLCCSLLYYAFIRPGESRFLTWGDVDLDGRLITVPGNIAKNKKEQQVLLPGPLFEQLLLLGKELDYKPNWLLLPGSGGATVAAGANTMATRHRKILKNMGFDCAKYKLYSWKHSGAVHLAQNGAKLIDISRQMRHASLEETAGYLRQYGVLHLQDLKDKFHHL